MLLIHGRAGPAPKEEPPTSATPSAPATVQPEMAPPEPDERTAEEDDEDDWVPGPTNLPLGPWLAVAAIEIMLFSPALKHQFPWPMSLLFGIGR